MRPPSCATPTTSPSPIRPRSLRAWRADISIIPTAGFTSPTARRATLAPLIGRDMREADVSWAGAAGGIVSTPRDLARWIRAVFGGKVLPPKQLKEYLALVSTKTGKPIAKVTEDDPRGFALGSRRAFSSLRSARCGSTRARRSATAPPSCSRRRTTSWWRPRPTASRRGRRTARADARQAVCAGQGRAQRTRCARQLISIGPLMLFADSELSMFCIANQRDALAEVLCSSRVPAEELRADKPVNCRVLHNKARSAG